MYNFLRISIPNGKPNIWNTRDANVDLYVVGMYIFVITENNNIINSFKYYMGKHCAGSFLRENFCPYTTYFITLYYPTAITISINSWPTYVERYEGNEGPK